MASKGARRFHEPGVGSRTGMRITDGAEDIDDFMNAGMAAMDRHPDDYSDEEEQYADEYDDDEEESADGYDTGRGRRRKSTMSSSSVRRGGASSSMMDIEQSSAPSPRSAIRKSMGSRASRGSLLDRSDYNADDVEFDDVGADGPSFDLSNLAGDDDADLYGDEDLEDEEDDRAAARVLTRTPQKGPFSSSSPRKGPSSGLEARKAARAAASNPPSRKKPAYRGVSEDEEEEEIYDDDEDIQAEMQLDGGSRGGDYIEEIVEEDVGAEALEGTTAGEWERREAEAAKPKKRGRPPGKGKAASKEPAAKKAKAAATGAKKPRGRPRKVAQMYDDEEDDDDEDDDDDDAYGGVRIDKRTVKKFSSTSPRKPTSVQQQIVERVPSAYHRPDQNYGSEEPEGRGVALRKSERYKFKPLEWWRGERVRYGRPSILPSSSQGNDENSGTGGGGSRKKSRVAQPVPVLKEVIRVVRQEDEGTFSGMRKPGAPKTARYVKRKRVGSVRAESESEPQPLLEEETGRVVHPEDGWDDETEAHGLVWDPEKEEEIERRIACTARQAQPKMTFNNAFAFEKIFGADACMAAGLLEIPVQGQKPSKPSKDNNYVFVVIEGAVRVRIHRTNILIAPGGMFLVPKGNNYSIENVSQRTARIFFTQARTERAGEGSGNVGAASSGKDVGNASGVMASGRGDSSWMDARTTAAGSQKGGTRAGGAKSKKLR